MKRNFLSICAMAVAIFAANAQEQTGTNAAPVDEKAEVPEAVEMLQVAGQLVKYGYAQQSALPLIQAVEIYQAYTGSKDIEDPTKATEANEGAPAGAAGEKGESAVSFDVQKLLADATEYSDNDPNYLAIIETLKNSGSRGATSNYDVHYDRVEAYSTDTYRIRFRGGERACVVVSGDGDTDLDLYIYDENGNLVASDTDYTDDCVCVWNPRWTGPFTIKIVNRGRVFNRYALAVN